MYTCVRVAVSDLDLVGELFYSKLEDGNGKPFHDEQRINYSIAYQCNLGPDPVSLQILFLNPSQAPRDR